MWAIIQKEFNVFFTSFIGIGLMFSFYLLIGLYTWFFQGNVLDFGFAELSVFFDLSPWFFLFFSCTGPPKTTLPFSKWPM